LGNGNETRAVWFTARWNGELALWGLFVASCQNEQLMLAVGSEDRRVTASTSSKRISNWSVLPFLKSVTFKKKSHIQRPKIQSTPLSKKLKFQERINMTKMQESQLEV
jgi:hypothetical protein